MSGYRFYGDQRSGNCLKVLWTARLLNLPFEWVELDLMKGETRTEEFLRLNPAGQTPVAVLPDGRTLAQSNAIVLHLAEGSSLIPADAYERAKMLEWLFWEQYSHEPSIATRRWRLSFLKQRDDEIDPALITRGRQALTLMERALEGRDFFVGAALSAADIALVAYTRVAHEGGFDLTETPRVRQWVMRVEGALGLAPAREAA